MDDSTGTPALEHPVGSVAWRSRLFGWLMDPERSKARIGALLGLSFALFTFGAAAIEGPNKAFGKRWSTSSSAGECHPEQRTCAGQATTVLFMTKEEDSPWFVVDLGSATQVHEVDVVNRLDAEQAAAAPLVVETSLDGVHFEPRGVRERAFSRLRARFPRTTARYVRLRVDRRSVLHLESVKVR